MPAIAATTATKGCSATTEQMAVGLYLVRVYRGLSRMRGNSHVRFLGGGGAEMPCCYPTASPLPQALPETDPAGENRRVFLF